MSDSKIIEFFSLAEHHVDSEKISRWLAKESHPEYLECEDHELSTFLNGLICGLRGQKEGPLPEPDKKMTNNLILKKLKIALDLQNENVIEIFASVGLSMNKYELTGFLRKSNHKNYRTLKYQDLRAFLKGLELKKLSLETVSENR
jgi:uncharacterized protein YehS (DUF1456 family)